MITLRRITRRSFLKTSGLWFGSALLVGMGGTWLPMRARVAEAATLSHFMPNEFIAIPETGPITLMCHRSEMGQGTRTAMAMLLAEELDVDWPQIVLVQANGDARFGDQNTDGSKSVRDFFVPLRQMGATARAMLVQAAAATWHVPVEACRTSQGHVIHDATGRSLRYGELIAAAAAMPVPKNPRLKSRGEFRLIGKPQVSRDLGAITSGTAVFGIDVHLDGMLYASIERAPARGTRLKAYDPAPALAVPGVVRVIPLPAMGDPSLTNEGVAVVADNTWTALQGRKALKITWDQPPLGGSDTLRATMDARLQQPCRVYRNEGDVDAQRTSGSRVIEAQYNAPYLVHAPMEPPVCTVRLTPGRCEIWAPSQDPQRAKAAVAALLHLPPDKVTLHVTFLGGGFGRKSQPDFILEAVAVARELKRPVKVTWTREDEIQHGIYHAESRQKLTATVDGSGALTGWHHRSVFPTIQSLFIPALVAPVLPMSWEPHDFEMTMGVTNLPYRIPNIRCEGAAVKSDVRIGWLRSVCNLFHAFAVNSFIDEIAHATKRDPVKMRLALLEGDPTPAWGKTGVHQFDRRRLAKVIETVAERGGWGKPQAKGSGQGFAAHYSFLSYVAVLIETVVTESGVSVPRVHIGIDCGLAVNPDSVIAQMQGSVVFGLSAALHGEITLANGAVQQSNFHNYQVLRMSECPEIHMHLIESDAAPTGVGEPGVPPIAPALCNAIFAASGRRIRDLPVSKYFQS
ncbi:MAG: xanthine dehydrogenase family protein molybdopterin-binding subunit [Candidatus Sericytochromatia bacterium]|nr:xanthine dehydrogenase family protein molybdopterin-binding subunit [Candidatus Sericytochromatia bacterium]